MFIIYLWDKNIGESIESLEDFSGNEKFLIRNDYDTYPLLSELSSCDMELFSGEQLIELSHEIHRLLQDELLEKSIYEYLLSVTFLIDKAYRDNKSILFSPF